MPTSEYFKKLDYIQQLHLRADQLRSEIGDAESLNGFNYQKFPEGKALSRIEQAKANDAINGTDTLTTVQAQVNQERADYDDAYSQAETAYKATIDALPAKKDELMAVEGQIRRLVNECDKAVRDEANTRLSQAQESYKDSVNSLLETAIEIDALGYLVNGEGSLRLIRNMFIPNLIGNPVNLPEYAVDSVRGIEAQTQHASIRFNRRIGEIKTDIEGNLP